MAARRRGVSLPGLRRLALALPGVEEGSSYGTPAFRVRGRLFARLHQDGESLVVRMDLDERELALEAGSEVFHITDHYRDHPMVLVRLARIDRAALADVLEASWRSVAPKRLARELEENR